MKRVYSVRFWKKLLAFSMLILAVLACSVNTDSLPEQAGTAASPASSVPAGLETPVHSAGIEEIPMQVGYGMRGPFYEIYFTAPTNPAASREEGGPDVHLAEAINAARISIDVAAYSFSLYSLQDALIKAFKRGVQVRIVMESDNLDGRGPQALKAAGIPIVGDRREGLMHDKFMVIDRAEVWTGSMNFTTSGTYQDNNNLIRIRSVNVAKNFTVEFEEMYKDDFFGPDTIAETPYPELMVDGVQLEIYFSPDDHVARRIAALLRGAKQSINFMAYSFTANDFGDILRQKARNGLLVEGVMESSQVKSNQGSEFDAFNKAGLYVYLDGNPGLMHHKVIIIDQEIVITGSYNFTASAERSNDENVVIFFDKQVAARYLAEFQRVYDTAPKPPGKP
ncbi:MAG: phospholipase D-like domain-containing protein [Chloroflexi bacterium]|nr:phospholipase D-like domain-containing protein [Chloroflexota bacterium]